MHIRSKTIKQSKETVNIIFGKAAALEGGGAVGGGGGRKHDHEKGFEGNVLDAYLDSYSFYYLLLYGKMYPRYINVYLFIT